MNWDRLLTREPSPMRSRMLVSVVSSSRTVMTYKTLHQFDLLIGERTHLLAVDDEHPTTAPQP